MADRPEVERLRATQQQRAEQEADAGEQAVDSEERRVHERRADKAAYLRDKLAEQAQTPDAEQTDGA